MTVTTTQLPQDKIGEQYGRMRLVRPKAEQQMLHSLRRYGQMSPVVVCQTAADRYELIDGFKRLRASRQIEAMTSLSCRVLPMSLRAAKAAMLCLNWVTRSVSDLEEGWVVHSLCRHDGLSQLEVSQLLGKDSSWVSRRLALVERLSEEVQAQLRLGLINGSVARELARLPRGKQSRAFEAVSRFQLGARDTAAMVKLLMASDGRRQEQILNAPYKALGEQAQAQRPRRDARLSQAGNQMRQQLSRMEQACNQVARAAGIKDLSRLQAADLVVLAPPMGRAQRAARQAVQKLDDAMTATTEA